MFLGEGAELIISGLLGEGFELTASGLLELATLVLLVTGLDADVIVVCA
jgi:hypothetical protein